MELKKRCTPFLFHPLYREVLSSPPEPDFCICKKDSKDLLCLQCLHGLTPTRAYTHAVLSVATTECVTRKPCVWTQRNLTCSWVTLSSYWSILPSGCLLVCIPVCTCFMQMHSDEYFQRNLKKTLKIWNVWSIGQFSHLWKVKWTPWSL